MTSYQRKFEAANYELEQLKKDATPINRFLSYSVTMDAALNIMIKHDMLMEFAAEIARLKGIADGLPDTAALSPAERK